MQKDLSNELIRLKKLYELSRTISGDPVEVFRHIAKIIGELFELKIVCLSKINGDQLDFLAIYHEGQIFTDAGSCELAITPCATVEMAQDVQIYDHVKERFPDALFLQQHNAHSYCGFPCLGNDGKVKAVTCLLDDKPREYTGEDIEILRIFGQRIGMEIERQEHIQSVKASQQRIEFLAHHDILTELPNRILLTERFKLAIAQVKREEILVGLISLDLDHFKVINDSLGHHTGDLLLKEVVGRLKTCVRDVDTISRQGGDQFIILLPDIHAANDVAIVAQKILEIFKNPFLIDGDSVKITASLGIVLFPKDGNDLSQLLQYADTAMYHAKDSGGNGCQFFNEEMAASSKERLHILNHIRQALEFNQFKLHYQSQVDTVTRKIIACEALIRWETPDGFIPPGKFIPVAENSGIILEIDAWVVDAACRQAKIWQDAGTPLVVAVNISASQFKRGDIIDLVSTALERHQLDPSLLEIELTESILIHDTETMRQVLSQLKQLGIKFSIDDFGTGYSNLSYLRMLHLDKIKIDQSFITHMATNENDKVIVRSTIDLAHNLGLKVIAEGVETASAVELLEEFGCDQLQGYHFGKPMPPELFVNFTK